MEEEQNPPKLWKDFNEEEKEARRVVARTHYWSSGKIGVVDEETGIITLKEPNKEDIKLIDAYYMIVSSLQEYCDIEKRYYPLIAVWIIGTYYHNLFPTYPYLFFNAMKGSGKSRLLKLITYLSKDGDMLNSPTDAVLFREQGTLGIDEFEGLGRKGKETLRELLNSAYKKGSKVKRMKKVTSREGESQQVEEFEVYRPIVMANISGMEEVLGDRCLSIVIDKSSNPLFTKKMEIYEFDEKLHSIKSFPFEKCSLCSVDVIKTMYREWNAMINYTYYTIYNNNTNYTNYTNNTTQEYKDFFNEILKTDINGRQLELSLPLLFLAKFINYGLFQQILIILEDICSERKKEDLNESIDVSLIDFISQMINDGKWISLKETLKNFKESIQNEDDWMNDRWFGRALKRLNLLKDKKRMNFGMLIILDVEKAQEKIKMFK
jgi:hypothetical protein